MVRTPTRLIEQQIVEVIEYTNYRANILRSQGLAKEADKEVATGILTALVLTKAYCMYMYLEEDICISLENILKSTLAVYTIAYRIDVENELLGQLTEILKHSKEETISIPS